MTGDPQSIPNAEISDGIVLIHPGNIMRLWPRLRHNLQAVVKPQTGYNLDQVLTLLQTGAFQAWVIDDYKAVAVTYVVNRPLHNVLWVQFIAGKNADQWLKKLSKALRKAARKMDCKAVEFAGRRGWSRIKKDYPEFREIYYIFRCEVN